MRPENLQGLLALALVAAGCVIVASWGVAILTAGFLLFLDYSVDRWRSR